MHVAVCAALKSVGIDHYDFRNPPGGTGFSWKEVRPGFGTVCDSCGQVRPDHDLLCADGHDEGLRVKGAELESISDYYNMIEHDRAIEGYQADIGALEHSDTVVLVLPCGKSAHLELGYAAGSGKNTAILLEDPVEPELMYRMVDYISPNLFDLLGWLGVED